MCAEGVFRTETVARCSGTASTPMTQYVPPHSERTDRKPPGNDRPIASGVALLAMLVGALVVASYPVAAVTIVGSLVVAVLLVRAGGPALGRRLHGRVTELEVPGLGTVRISVTAR